MLRATTACNVPFLIWPDGSAPAALASLLFDHLEPQIIGKHSVSRLCYLFAQLDLLSSDFSSFSSLLFSDSSHLCSSSVHIIGSLTSKLPSVIIILYIYILISWDLMGQHGATNTSICHYLPSLHRPEHVAWEPMSATWVSRSSWAAWLDKGLVAWNNCICQNVLKPPKTYISHMTRYLIESVYG